MAEYIEREVVFDKLAVIYDLARTDQRAVITDALREVSHIPAADLQPVKRGEWGKKSSVGVFRCSLCQHIFMLGTDEIDEYHFCPHCGADMRNDSNLMKNRS